MQRADFLNGIYAVASAVPLAGQVPPPKEVAGVLAPDSPLAKEAASIALSCEPPEIFSHSLRGFYFAELIGKAKGISHDVEAVYVASMLHDTGLMAPHMSATERFQVDGANVSRELLERYGIEAARADLVWDAISLHDQNGIARWKHPEVMLVSAGVSADFGGYLEILKRAEVIAVLEAAPRSNFIPVFLNAIATAAKRKPLATGLTYIADVAYHLVPGFHLGNFYDDVKDNPFADYGTAGAA
jgi:hypothetical protein